MYLYYLGGYVYQSGMLAKEEKVLKGLPNRNIVSLTMLIVGYTKHNQVHGDLDPSRRRKMRAFPQILSSSYAS